MEQQLLEGVLVEGAQIALLEGAQVALFEGVLVEGALAALFEGALVEGAPAAQFEGALVEGAPAAQFEGALVEGAQVERAAQFEGAFALPGGATAPFPGPLEGENLPGGLETEFLGGPRGETSPLGEPEFALEGAQIPPGGSKVPPGESNFPLCPHQGAWSQVARLNQGAGHQCPFPPPLPPLLLLEAARDQRVGVSGRPLPHRRWSCFCLCSLACEDYPLLLPPPPLLLVPPLLPLPAAWLHLFPMKEADGKLINNSTGLTSTSSQF